MSSDSELSVAVPDDDALGTALKDAVNTAFANGKQGELSINSIRSAVEKELDLDGGFFKSHDKWKSLSKSIIGEAVVGLSVAESKPPLTRSRRPQSKPHQKLLRKVQRAMLRRNPAVLNVNRTQPRSPRGVGKRMAKLVQSLMTRLSAKRAKRDRLREKRTAAMPRTRPGCPKRQATW